MTLGMLALLGLVFVSALGLTKLLCSPALTLAFLDHPNERSLHAAPLPRTGGLALWGSVTVGLLLSLALGWIVPTSAAGWILGATLFLAGISFWDDRSGLSPALRLGAQALAATAVIWGAGLKIDAVETPLRAIPLGWFAVPVTILFLIWMANLYNFMDGMDGLAGGMTVLGFGFLGYIAGRGGQPFVMMLCFLIGMACCGFLLYNLPPARIFMGDVGSVPLGFLAAALAVLGVHDGAFDIWVPLLIFSPFIADATVTLFRRLLKGDEVWRAHREHYYQRLVLAGWGHRKTMVIEYVLMLACGFSAMAYVQAGPSWRLVILLGWSAVYAVLIWAVCAVERQARVMDPRAERV
jgi:UDP-N-acetylmuramyl pentapeptide phosphotransferase/UDP-N-acetylglucosamine-1-phosphate transferase